jgi:hypothetical protein
MCEAHCALSRIANCGKLRWALKRAGVVTCVRYGSSRWWLFLTSESVQSTTLALQSVDDVHGCDGLPLGVLGVGDGITDDVLKEHLEDTSGFFVNQTRDTFDTTSASKTADSGFGDTLDVITKYFSVTLGASLSESLSTFTAARHCAKRLCLFSTRERINPENPDLGSYIRLGLRHVTLVTHNGGHNSCSDWPKTQKAFAWPDVVL